MTGISAQVVLAPRRMRAHSVFRALGCTIVFAAACTPGARADLPADTAATAAASTTPAAPTESWSVRLERGACFGTCPMYAVDLNIDGSVKFKGVRFVVDSAEHTASVSAESVRALREQMNAAGFKTLPANYTNGNKECGRWHTDAPRVTITLTEGTATHTVVHDYGCSDVPPVLKTLEQAIDNVAQTSQWMAPAKTGKP